VWYCGPANIRYAKTFDCVSYPKPATEQTASTGIFESEHLYTDIRILMTYEPTDRKSAFGIEQDSITTQEIIDEQVPAVDRRVTRSCVSDV
jgi:hypothetical protein